MNTLLLIKGKFPAPLFRQFKPPASVNKASEKAAPPLAGEQSAGLDLFVTPEPDEGSGNAKK